MIVSKKDSAFESLAKKLVQVPKKELTQQVKKYRAKRKRRKKD
jgi:hypothetical protein